MNGSWRAASGCTPVSSGKNMNHEPSPLVRNVQGQCPDQKPAFGGEACMPGFSKNPPGDSNVVKTEGCWGQSRTNHWESLRWVSGAWRKHCSKATEPLPPSGAGKLGIGPQGPQGPRSRGSRRWSLVFHHQAPERSGEATPRPKSHTHLQCPHFSPVPSTGHQCF